MVIVASAARVSPWEGARTSSAPERGDAAAGRGGARRGSPRPGRRRRRHQRQHHGRGLQHQQRDGCTGGRVSVAREIRFELLHSYNHGRLIIDQARPGAPGRKGAIAYRYNSTTHMWGSECNPRLVPQVFEDTAAYRWRKTSLTGM